jgi:hypothetical protein
VSLRFQVPPIEATAPFDNGSVATLLRKTSFGLYLWNAFATPDRDMRSVPLAIVLRPEVNAEHHVTASLAATARQSADRAVGAGHEHGIALVALLYLPVAVMTLPLALDSAARAGSLRARRLRCAYLSTSPTVQLAAFGMLISATVHLALADAHMGEALILGSLFALDGVALLAVALWTLVRPLPGWRAAGIGLLATGVIAYVAYVAAGREMFDAVGMATKAVELATIGLLVLPSDGGARDRWHSQYI